MAAEHLACAGGGRAVGRRRRKDVLWVKFVLGGGMKTQVDGGYSQKNQAARARVVLSVLGVHPGRGMLPAWGGVRMTPWRR